jgi:hypothetical protein
VHACPENWLLRHGLALAALRTKTGPALVNQRSPDAASLGKQDGMSTAEQAAHVSHWAASSSDVLRCTIVWRRFDGTLRVQFLTFPKSKSSGSSTSGSDEKVRGFVPDR